MRKALLFAALSAALTPTLFTGCAPKAKAPTEGPTAQAPSTGAPATDGAPATEAQQAKGPGEPGGKAFNFTGTTLQGKQVALSDFKGKTVLVNFFSPT